MAKIEQETRTSTPSLNLWYKKSPLHFCKGLSKKAATYSPTWYSSTIGANGLNFPVRNGSSSCASTNVTPRLACVRPAASVHPEPGSNSSSLFCKYSSQRSPNLSRPRLSIQFLIYTLRYTKLYVSLILVPLIQVLT